MVSAMVCFYYSEFSAWCPWVGQCPGTRTRMFASCRYGWSHLFLLGVWWDLACTGRAHSLMDFFAMVCSMVFAMDLAMDFFLVWLSFYLRVLHPHLLASVRIWLCCWPLPPCNVIYFFCRWLLYFDVVALFCVHMPFDGVSGDTSLVCLLTLCCLDALHVIYVCFVCFPPVIGLGTVVHLLFCCSCLLCRCNCLSNNS